MPNANCNHGNSAPEDILDNLPEPQAGTGHHKCAICAYNEGYKAGIKHAVGGTAKEGDEKSDKTQFWNLG